MGYRIMAVEININTFVYRQGLLPHTWMMFKII